MTHKVQMTPERQIMPTRAIQTLIKAQVPFEVTTYTHKEKGAAFAAQAIGFPLEKTVKTLIAELGGRRYVAALLPGNTQLDLKKLARAFHIKHASMLSSNTGGYRFPVNYGIAIITNTSSATRMNRYPLKHHTLWLY